MKSMTLRNKLLAGSLAMVIFVMASSAIVVSMVINKQNRTASYQNLEKSLNIIREELSVTQKKLLSNVRQMATVNDMGSQIKFIQQFKGTLVIGEPLRKIAYALEQIGMTGNLWKSAIYHSNGELCTFAVHQGAEESLMGIVSDASRGSLKGITIKEGKQIEEDWKDLGTFHDPKIKVIFDKGIPKKETMLFEDTDNTICLTSFVPIFAEEYSEKTDVFEKIQVGFAMGIRKLDKSFVERMSKLTTMKINVFSNEGLSLGDLKDYTSLKMNSIKQSGEKWDLKKQGILLNDIDLKEGTYFQGVLPLYGATRLVGAIAALQSTDIVKSNTWQMIKLLGLVYLACILVIMPCAFVFSNSLTKPINKIIRTLTATSQKISSASAQVSTSSQQLAEGATEQSASLEEASSSLEEMSSMTQNNANSATEVDNLTNETNRIVGKANDSMTLLTTSMDEISKASEETSKIVKTIDEIAFQTNLLALNAAVEAARAGEAGAGFAVVADEVRNLAIRAADAARNTAELIEDTVKKVKDGTGLLAETSGAFAEVSDSSKKVGELTSEIATASNEQAQGIEHINRAVTEMDKVIQQNAVNAQESASASQELNAEAAQMKKVVNDLVTLVGDSAVVEEEMRPSKNRILEKPVSGGWDKIPFTSKNTVTQKTGLVQAN